MHRTGYDSLIESFEFEMQLIDELELLSKYGEWCINSGITKDIKKVSNYVKGFKDFHIIESYEKNNLFS